MRPVAGGIAGLVAGGGAVTPAAGDSSTGISGACAAMAGSSGGAAGAGRCGAGSAIVCSAIGSGSGSTASGGAGAGTRTGSTSDGGASVSAGGFADLTSRGGGSAGAAGLTGSGALPPGFFPFSTAGVSANDAFDGTLSPRCRDMRETNSRATTSSIVLDALFTSMPWSRLSSAITSWLEVFKSSATL